MLLLCDTAHGGGCSVFEPLEFIRVPMAAIRVTEAGNDARALLFNIGGVVAIGFVTSGIAQGCPLSGVFLVCAQTPSGVVSMGFCRGARPGW